MSKLISVIGPTASGKTSLAIKIAKDFNGELVNTDSRQIYKHLNIGTAKGDLNKTNRKVIVSSEFKVEIINKYQRFDLNGEVIHLVDLLTPDRTLSLEQYQKLAYCAIEDILSRNKLPILVGGTGLYIDSIVKNYEIPKVEPDAQLRKELNKKNVSQLQNILGKLNKTRLNNLNNSDLHNPRRLIRAIEIEKNKDKKSNIKKFQKNWNTLFLMPKFTREELYEKINNRVSEALEQGFLKEVRSLIERGYTFDTPAFSAIAYPLAKDFINEKITREEFLDKWRQYERNYARKQITWFKRYDFTKVAHYSRKRKLIKEFLDPKL